MNSDIADILDEWPFDPNSNVRQIRASDGREKIQVRIEQGPFRGILQMDLEGRPDGVRPHGWDFALDYYTFLRDSAHNEGNPDFSLDRTMCKELFAESKCIYERYAFLLQLADFKRVVRDAERNMRLFRFVHEHAEHPDDRDNLERWWPYLLRIHGTARAMIALAEKTPKRAIAIVEEARRQLNALKPIDAVEFRIELERSLEALDELEAELNGHVEPSMLERLETELQEAVDKEDFEVAAILRDRIFAINNGDQANDDDDDDDDAQQEAAADA